MRRTDRTAGKVASLILFALFTMVLMLALVAGARVYGALAASQDQVREDRLADNLVVNAVRANDSFDAVSAMPGPEGAALVLTERTPAGIFETRIYQVEGMLYQEYCAEGAPFDVAAATPLVATGSFWFSLDDGLLTVHTDEGASAVALRSAQVPKAVRSDG